MDYYLKFSDKAAMRAAFGSVTTETPHGPHTVHPLVEGLAVDIIGLIYEPTGETYKILGPDGGEIDAPVMAPLEGWHVNLRGDSLPDGLEQYTINPTNPRRVWA